MRMDIKMEKMSQKALERKSNKPIMEKKRRARINHCLNQLKSLILEADNERSRHSKLEKADILEMTVKYLQTLRAYHVHLNQINQLQQHQSQQQHHQSQQHQQLQHHFQQQLTANLKLVADGSPLGAQAAVHQAPANLSSPSSSGPQSPIDLQMPVRLSQLPLPLQLSLQAAAASHQLPQSSPEISPKSSSSATSSPQPSHHSVGHQQQALQNAHQNHQHLNRHHQQQQQHLNHHLNGHHHLHNLHHHQHLAQQISPTWRPW